MRGCIKFDKQTTSGVITDKIVNLGEKHTHVVYMWMEIRNVIPQMM